LHELTRKLFFPVLKIVKFEKNVDLFTFVENVHGNFVSGAV